MLWRWLLPLYTAMQLTVTHLPPDDTPSAPFPLFDKAVHFCGYAGWGLVAGMVGGPWRLWLAGGLALGAADELTQPYFGRHADINDWLADAAGLSLPSVEPLTHFAKSIDVAVWALEGIQPAT